MPVIPTADYTLLDNPYVLDMLFHPRPGYNLAPTPSARKIAIPVAQEVTIGGRPIRSENSDPGRTRGNHRRAVLHRRCRRRQYPVFPWQR